jgi:hypothetical protein
MEVLVEYRDKLTALAEKLVAEETVDADELEKLFTDLPPKERVSAPQQPAAAPPVAAASPSPSPA